MRPIVRFVLMAVLFAGPVLLCAQFNGPADTARDTVNTPHPVTTNPDILYPKTHDTVLRAGDSIKITLYGVSDYTATGRISEEGSLPIPLVEPVPIGNHTIAEAIRIIAGRLEAAGMFKSPQVEIQVLESPKSNIVLIGETKGIVNGAAGSRRLFDVLAQSGGVAATTSHIITIERPGVTDSINVDLGTDPERSRFANVPVFPGDTIVTSRIGSYYLLGAFRAPGAYPLTNTAPLTMMQMLASGGGKLYEAKMKEFHLVRTNGTQRTLTVVNMDDVVNGRTPDPVLQADDIVFAPSSQIKAALRTGGLTSAVSIIVTLFALTRY